MSIRNSTIILTILYALIAFVQSYGCPEDCTCSIITHGSHTQNHIKCDSIDSLKIDGKYPQLHSLDLSNLSLTRIDDIHLEKFKDLYIIDLSNNKLSEVGKLGKRIKTLNLSSNSITSGKLSKIPIHVENLNLSYNEISYLPLDLMKLTNLRSIELIGNTINCTCETLEVRNWLQKNHVWTDNHIKCSHPADVKGQPWLRVRQSDICDYHETKPRSIPLRVENADVDENELMLGDQPIVHEGSGEKDSAEEIGKDFLPVDEKLDSIRKDDEMALNDSPGFEANFEGSGDLLEHSTVSAFSDDQIDRIDTPLKSYETHSAILDEQHIGSGAHGLNITDEEDDTADVDSDGITNRTDDEDDEGSGSGMGIMVLGRSFDIGGSYFNQTVDIFNEAENDTNNDDEPISEPQEEVTESDDIFGRGLGIAQFSTEGPEHPIEEIIVPIKDTSAVESVPKSDTNVNGTYPNADGEGDEDKASIVLPDQIVNGEQSSINEANTGDNKATFILLGIVLFILIALIAFVAIKRTRARRNPATDAENPRDTELMDMDKTNLGKPINRNGNTEHAPLINNRDKNDFAKPVNGERKPPYKQNDDKDNNLQEPLLKILENKDEPHIKDVNEKIPEPKESNNNVTNSVPIENSIKPQTQPQKNEIPIPAPRPNRPLTPEQQAGRYPPPKSKSPSTNGDDEVFSPSSPKTSRYSPVYSPETGRVKIKISETAKPKTPLLVTRSKSNAGDIITTPNLNQRTVDQ